jgi:hypothetical protein
MTFRETKSANLKAESFWGGRNVSACDPPLSRAKTPSVDMTRYSGAFPGKAYPFATRIKAGQLCCFHFWGDRREI